MCRCEANGIWPFSCECSKAQAAGTGTCGSAGSSERNKAQGANASSYASTKVQQGCASQASCKSEASCKGEASYKGEASCTKEVT